MQIMKPIKIMAETPLEEMKANPTKTRIFIKRDDMNGLLVSGNKTRKLEYVIADAKRKKCDTLITCGGLQSNHCRTTAAFSSQVGLCCHLFLRGKPKKRFEGNLLINKLLGAQINYITPTQYRLHRDELMAQQADKLQKKGHKAYVIPEGASSEVGALGYLGCMDEMASFIKRQKIEAIYCPVGSGGTYAGLLLGKKMHGLNTHIHGVIVCDTVEYFKQRVRTICHDAIQRFELPIEITKKDIRLVDGYIGPGYAKPYPEEIETIKTIATSGIILDPVYTGKAFYGMQQQLKTRRYKKVIFVHTGGLFSIFAFQTALSNVLP
jgi:D-cysteine desulfhydrase